MSEKKDIEYLCDKLDMIEAQIEKYQKEIELASNDVTKELQDNLAEIKLERMGVRAEIAAFNQPTTSIFKKYRIRVDVLFSKLKDAVDNYQLKFSIQRKDLSHIEDCLNKHHFNKDDFFVEILFDRLKDKDESVMASRKIVIANIKTKESRSYSSQGQDDVIWLANFQNDLEENVFKQK